MLKDLYARHWADQQHGESTSSNDGPNEIIEAVEAVLGSGSELLDVGCGAGSVADLARARFQRVCGCDVSIHALRHASLRGMVVVCVDLNADVLPYRDNSFDCVTCLEVIEHVVDPLRLLKELHRVLRPHGQLVITTPNIRYVRNILKLVREGRFPHTTTDTFVWGGGHLHYFTRADLAQLLGEAGFAHWQFVVNEKQFVRSWKRQLLVKVLGNYQFGEWLCGGMTVSAIKR